MGRMGTSGRAGSGSGSAPGTGSGPGTGTHPRSRAASVAPGHLASRVLEGAGRSLLRVWEAASRVRESAAGALAERDVREAARAACEGAREKVGAAAVAASRGAASLVQRARAAARAAAAEESAQGTTEYAILVGVLVVIAILAIIAFRDRVSSLWEAIASGVNSL